MGQLIEHAGAWTPEDRFTSAYQYLPVDVPAGTAALLVSLECDRAAGVLDLGCLDTSGFRGWSGGARESFVITASEATPGYLPGPLPEGTVAGNGGAASVGTRRFVPDFCRS